jgi:hypothetical protein
MEAVRTGALLLLKVETDLDVLYTLAEPASGRPRSILSLLPTADAPPRINRVGDDGSFTIEVDQSRIVVLVLAPDESPAHEAEARHRMMAAYHSKVEAIARAELAMMSALLDQIAVARRELAGRCMSMADQAEEWAKDFRLQQLEKEDKASTANKRKETQQRERVTKAERECRIRRSALEAIAPTSAELSKLDATNYEHPEAFSA